VVSRRYVPDAGDLVWLTFDPQSGREEAGRRPALILSPAAYNARAGLAIACPITTRVKGYPFEVPLAADSPVTGVILADHVKSIDWRSRRAERAGRVPDETLADTRERLRPLLGL